MAEAPAHVLTTNLYLQRESDCVRARPQCAHMHVVCATQRVCAREAARVPSRRTPTCYRWYRYFLRYDDFADIGRAFSRAAQRARYRVYSTLSK